MLNLYKFISYILIPIILINLYVRLINNKEDSKRYKERIGKTNFNLKLSKKIIWIHAASVGEFKSSDLIIEKYYKNFQILITTTTKSSAEYIERYYNKKVVHQYIPFDVPFWCSRFLNFWKPSLILWIESDIWPNMLKVIKDRKIKCLYINARISPQSFNKWKNLKNLYSKSLNTFDKIYAQSPDDLIRIKKLSHTNVEYIGNLKLANIKSKKIFEKRNEDFSIMLASSHENEEEIVAKNILDLLNKNKSIKFYIAPRHPHRSTSIKKMLKKFNLDALVEDEINTNKSNVTIISSFGNLDKYFHFSDIVILGGSFVKKGGHNPIEPSLYDCAILTGSNIFNWKNVYDDMLNDNACIIINKTDEINEKISFFFKNQDTLNNYKKMALKFSNKIFFEDTKLMYEINLLLDNV